jgi:hypothetical protein
MWRILVLVLTLAGCAQLPPTPQEIQAKHFEPVPGRSVIYIVRDYPDFNYDAATLTLDNAAGVTLYAGTFYRWEVPAGKHRIAGYAGDSGVINLDTAPDRVYYVQHRLSLFGQFTTSVFQVVGPSQGQAVAMRGKLMP